MSSSSTISSKKENLQRKKRPGSAISTIGANSSKQPVAKRSCISGNWKQFKGGKLNISNTDKEILKKKQLSDDTVTKAVSRKRSVADSSVIPPQLPFTPTHTRTDDCTLTEYVALDCEMIGVGEDGEESQLARVAIVNSYGNVVYDKYVKPQERVTDYRTAYSGIRPAHLRDAIPFKQVQAEVAKLIKNRIVVGHALHNDLRVLQLTHAHRMLRDTAKYRPLQRHKGKPKALRHLVTQHLGFTIQDGEHDPAIDARAAYLLYHVNRRQWEDHISGVKRNLPANSAEPKSQKGKKRGRVVNLASKHRDDDVVKQLLNDA